MKRLLIIPVALAAVLAGGAVSRVQEQCGPFTDVPPAFCPYVLEIYYLGITAGTSPTTYSSDSALTRGQAAVFVSKGINQAIARSSRRAALGQWWTTRVPGALSKSVVGFGAYTCSTDGADVWVPAGDGTVTRVRASDGRSLETWTDAAGAYASLAAMGRIFVTGQIGEGFLYMIDPAQPLGAVTTVATGFPVVQGLTFDGARIWVAVSGAVSIVTPGPSLPWAVKTVSGFGIPGGMVFDGSHVWVTDAVPYALLKLDSSGAVLQSVPTGVWPGFPIFDGANIWVPGGHGTVTVIQASTGRVLATLTGNGLDGSVSASFDGERVLVANSGPETLSLFRAADFAPLGVIPTGTATVPTGVCSDGVNFWVTLRSTNQLARF